MGDELYVLRGLALLTTCRCDYKININSDSSKKTVLNGLYFAEVCSPRLKGGRGSIFCVANFALITAFLSVDSPELQGPKFDQTHGSDPHGELSAYIKLGF